MKSYKLIPLSSLILLILFSALASAQVTRVVNSASLTDGAVAPGSIVTIFGTNLARGTATAPNAATPPATLGGVKITVGSVAATLFYVSPTQINALLAPNTPTGSQPLVITSDTGTFTSNITIDKSAAPGLFSLFGNGVRDAAVLNAISFKLGPFRLNPNGPTYLSLYGTGIDTTTTPKVMIGGVPAQVTFAGPAPCCAGLQQINVIVPPQLAGAGRVPVVLTTATASSNVVEIVILPQGGPGQGMNMDDNEANSREVAALAYIPGTSLALLTDENDDVVRVLDIAAKQVTKTIALPQDAEPVAVAVTSNGKLAAVVERNLNRVAIIDLTTFTVLGEVPTGNSPVAVAISGNTAVVANEGAGTVTFIDLTARTVIRTVTVGSGPRGIATDGTRVFVTNENSGTLTILDLASGNVTKTVQLGATVRPFAVQVVPNSNLVVITDVAAPPASSVLIYNIADGSVKPAPLTSGSPVAIAVAGSNIYLANQTGGSVTILSASTLTPTTVNVGIGARALAVDTKDNILLVTNEGSGKVVLVDLTKNTASGSIDGIRSEGEDQDNDDHGDRDHAANIPTITSVAPATAKAGTSFQITIKGTNLTGATDVIFVIPSSNPGKGKGHGNGNGNSGNHGNGAGDSRDAAFTVTNVQVTGGTQLTANVTVAASAVPGSRIVRVLTPNGESTGASSVANTITVTQ